MAIRKSLEDRVVMEGDRAQLLPRCRQARCSSTHLPSCVPTLLT
jgi:hypothetical protein